MALGAVGNFISSSDACWFFFISEEGSVAIIAYPWPWFVRWGDGEGWLFLEGVRNNLIQYSVHVRDNIPLDDRTSESCGRWDRYLWGGGGWKGSSIWCFLLVRFALLLFTEWWRRLISAGYSIPR